MDNKMRRGRRQRDMDRCHPSVDVLTFGSWFEDNLLGHDGRAPVEQLCDWAVFGRVREDRTVPLREVTGDGHDLQESPLDDSPLTCGEYGGNLICGSWLSPFNLYFHPNVIQLEIPSAGHAHHGDHSSGS